MYDTIHIGIRKIECTGTLHLMYIIQFSYLFWILTKLLVLGIAQLNTLFGFLP